MKPIVYFTPNISDENVVNILKILNPNLVGNIAVKIHSGEPGGHNYLQPQFIKKVVDYLHGTIVECNTAYDGGRNTSEKHWHTIKEHGFLTLGQFDLLDEDGEMELPIKNKIHLDVDYVGKNLAKYDSILILSHFKGHIMAGYGGALKNMSIGLASSHGKAYIHGAGNAKKIWTSKHDEFLESMAEAASAVKDHFGNQIAYINVLTKLSVDCDCMTSPEEPRMKDIGICASLDPVALDQACIDMVYSSEDPGKKYLIERIESRNGIHTVETAEKLGVGSRDYDLIKLNI
jgi:uncharacterized Fe-S center protein